MKISIGIPFRLWNNESQVLHCISFFESYAKREVERKTTPAHEEQNIIKSLNVAQGAVLWINEIGEIIKPDYLTTHFKAFLEEHNMPHIRFHDLRHSCATLLFAQGVPMKEIQAWLGHSTIGTTANIYTHLDENSKINSANAIIGILEQKKDTQSI